MRVSGRSGEMAYDVGRGHGAPAWSGRPEYPIVRRYRVVGSRPVVPSPVPCVPCIPCRPSCILTQCRVARIAVRAGTCRVLYCPLHTQVSCPRVPHVLSRPADTERDACNTGTECVF